MDWNGDVNQQLIETLIGILPVKALHRRTQDDPREKDRARHIRDAGC